MEGESGSSTVWLQPDWQGQAGGQEPAETGIGKISLNIGHFHRAIIYQIDCDNSDNTEKACLRDVRKYFDNIRDVLKYRVKFVCSPSLNDAFVLQIKQLDGFENKLKRFTRFNKLINKKAAKAGDFANVTDFLLAALGNQLGTNEDRQHYMFNTIIVIIIVIIITIIIFVIIIKISSLVSST